MKLLILFFSLFIAGLVHAQKLTHSIGMGAIFSATDIKSRTVSMPSITEYNTRINYIGAIYSLRLALLKKSNHSLSIGSPVTIGISWATLNDSHTFSILSSSMPLGLNGSGSKKPHFALELPIVLDHNIGAGSSPGSKKKFGAYIGAGAVYTYTTISLANGSNRTIDSYDPLIRAGIRMGANKPYTLGLSYKRSYQLGLQLLKDL